MPRPDPRRPRDGQIDLFEDVPLKAPDKLTRGRHSDAMDVAIAAARERDLVDEIDKGLLTVLRSGAWALDSLESSDHHYGIAKLINPMVDALREARMTPDSRQAASDDAVATLLEELNADDDAATSHAENAR
ncbi:MULTISPECIES: hypothetical protein [Corynebacterium]|uniref:Uncharacterized protein n=1 Tax=Corynebacterium hadale TaxID=2026255 RepID=A0A269PG27_9CORY|nr:hypothetical protein [Corynebacterium hadale]PAJ70928.1 hypothetical protein CIG21_01730 [Corynebacterium hadale]WKC60810.1 hypothetical protein CHAD_09785 [Corynebacterium hadale]